MSKLEENLEQIIEDRFTMSVKLLAQKYDVSERTMYRFLSDHNIERKLDRDDISNDVVLLHYNKGWSIHRIAEYFGTSVETISKRLKKMNVSYTRADGIRRALVTKYESIWPQVEQDLNDGVFKKDIYLKYKISKKSLDRMMNSFGYDELNKRIKKRKEKGSYLNYMHKQLYKIFGRAGVHFDKSAKEFFIPSQNLYITLKHVEERALKLKEKGYHYLVFPDIKCRDFEVWVASGCPMGRDYERIYSWLPERDFKVVRQKECSDLPTGWQASTKLMKEFQFDVFYEREIELWDENSMKDGISLQMFLYYNRLKHLGKNPFELSDKEVVNSFGISGTLRRFTAFDNRAMVQFLEKYNIKSVYDPFAGWGERMVTCLSRGIKYTGVDIRGNLKSGYDALLEWSGCTGGEFIVADSTEYKVPAGVDGVVTCPPYFNTEIYSDMGLESKSEMEFGQGIIKIFSNIAKSGIKYCAIQINQKYKLLFLNILKNVGYELIEEIQLEKQSSHFLKNRKKEFESMLVFKFERGDRCYAKKIGNLINTKRNE